jgi:hypothetical protein
LGITYWTIFVALTGDKTWISHKVRTKQGKASQDRRIVNYARACGTSPCAGHHFAFGKNPMPKRYSKKLQYS